MRDDAHAALDGPNFPSVKAQACATPLAYRQLRQQAMKLLVQVLFQRFRLFCSA